MRKTLLFAVLLTTTQIAIGQRLRSSIDSINSDKEVEKLIHSINEGYQKFTLKPITEFKGRYREDEPCKMMADSLNITKSWYKSDFDNNGYTDLLAIGEYDGFNIFVVMNYGHDSLKVNRLTRKSFQECTFPKIINDSILRYYYMREPDGREKNQSTALLYKDLIFKYGDFIEYNPKPNNYSIEKIEYQTTPCFGTCPVFYMSISKDRSAIFKAVIYNRKKRNLKQVEGKFNATLKDSSFLEIWNLLNYIDFPNLNDNYAVNWTDDQTCTLTITYNNGQVKKIRDYGLIGSYGLDRLYQLLFDLRFNQDWNKSSH
jgi:hypothetical protein